MIILGISIHEKTPNIEIREMAIMETVESMVRSRTLRWLGHLARMDHARLPCQLMVCWLEWGKHVAGGQKLRWNDVVARDLKKGKLLLECRSLARDRTAWRGAIAELVEELKEKAEGTGDSEEG